jgi:hypothetical protein
MKMSRNLAGPRQQRGVTLIVAMLMLLVFALVAVSAFRNMLSSSQAIGNMQFRNESIAAANDTIDQLLSSDTFATSPTQVTAQMNANPNTVDINGDNVPDIKVTFPSVKVAGVDRTGPQCIRARPVQNSELDPNSSSDVGCFSSGGSDFSGIGTASSDGGTTPTTASTSNCSDTNWTVTVQATDRATNTSVQVTQGIQLRRDRATATNYCQ